MPMPMPVKWEVDEVTSVEIKTDDEDGTCICVIQGDDYIRLHGTGASPGELAVALLAAIEATAEMGVFAFPDLSQFTEST